MRPNDKKQILEIPKDWIVNRNEFYYDSSIDNIPKEDNVAIFYEREDLLSLQKRQFHFDLGWYGSDDLKKQTTGFMLVLFRGQDWNNCELLELVRTRSKMQIISTINALIDLVEKDFYDNKTGYKINENDTDFRYIGQHFQYSVSNNLNELINTKNGGE